MFKMFLRVFLPNVIFFLCNANNYKRAMHKRNRLNELAQYKNAYVELAFVAFSSIYIYSFVFWKRFKSKMC